MKEEKEDQIWELLDRAKRETKPDPMFSKNVLREVRLLESEDKPVSFWSRLFTPQALLPIGATAVLAIASIFFFPDRQEDTTVAEGLQEETIIVSTAPDFDSLEEIQESESSEDDAYYLGSLLAFEDPNELNDEDIATLLFR